MLDNAAGDVQDILRRAVILFQPDYLGIGKMFLERENVGNVGAAPAIDRLVRIANDANVLLLLSQQTNQRELQLIRVLIFIDQQKTKPIIVTVAYLRHVAQQSNCLD